MGDHNDMAMNEISHRAYQLVSQLCAIYGQCPTYTSMVIIRDIAEGIEAACDDAEGPEEEARADVLRTELAEMLRGLANIIKPEGVYDVTTTKH